MTALMYASLKGHIEVIPLLLSHEANVNPQNKVFCDDNIVLFFKAVKCPFCYVF